MSQRCLSFTFPSQASSSPLFFPLPCFPHVSPPPPPPSLFCLPVLPQSSFHSCPPPLPFPFLSSAAVLFSLFLSSFTSMALAAELNVAGQNHRRAGVPDCRLKRAAAHFSIRADVRSALGGRKLLTYWWNCQSNTQMRVSQMCRDENTISL